MPIIMIGTNRATSERTMRNPSRMCDVTDPESAGEHLLPGKPMSRSAAMTTRKERALLRNVAEGPKAWSTAAAMVGPSARPAMNWTEFSRTAVR